MKKANKAGGTILVLILSAAGFIFLITALFGHSSAYSATVAYFCAAAVCWQNLPNRE